MADLGGREIEVGLPNMGVHHWDGLRTMPTERNNVHESVFRAYHVLDEVFSMVRRGDSMDTIEQFLRWVLDERRPNV